MTPWPVQFTRAAQKALDAIPADADRAAVLESVRRYVHGEPGANGKKLGGFTDRFSVRHGDWRAILVRDRAARRWTVIAVGNRKDVYRDR